MVQYTLQHDGYTAPDGDAFFLDRPQHRFRVKFFQVVIRASGNETIDRNGNDACNMIDGISVNHSDGA